MTTIAFDTLKFAQALKEKAHLTAEQAEGFASALADALHDDLATKADLREVELQLNAEIDIRQIRNHQMDVRHDWLSDGDHPRRGDRAARASRIGERLNLPLRKHRLQRRHRVPWRRRRLEHAEPHRDGARQHMRRRELAPIALAREQAREGQARFQRVVPSLARTLAVMRDQPVEEFWGAVAGFAVSPNVSPKPSPEASAGRKKPVWRVTTPSAATSSGVEAGKSRNISRDSSG